MTAPAPRAPSPLAARDRGVLRVLWIEGLANVVVLILKFVVGLTTGSLAILSDALHSLSDVANNVIALLIVRRAAAPADDDHPYGHRKYETLAVFVLAVLLAVLALELLLGAVRGTEHPVGSSPGELALMLGVLAINLGIAGWERAMARKLDSPILAADASHTLADALTTVAVIAGWQFAAHGWPWVDRVAAGVVAFMVGTLSYQLFRRATPILVDEVALDSETVRRALEDVPGVARTGRLRSRWIGQDAAVDVTIVVAPELDTAASHAIATQVEAVLEDRFAVRDVTVHVEPDLADPHSGVPLRRPAEPSDPSASPPKP